MRPACYVVSPNGLNEATVPTIGHGQTTGLHMSEDGDGSATERRLKLSDHEKFKEAPTP